MTTLDVSMKVLADLLHLSDHHIKISGAYSPDQGRTRVIRLYLDGENLPGGPVQAVLQKAADGTVTLKAIEPAH